MTPHDPLTSREAWDAQEREPHAAYYWFNRYLETAPTERSLNRVLSDAIDRQGIPDPSNPPPSLPTLSTLRRWSARWRWERRASLYDAHLERRKREVAEDEIVEASRRHALQLRLAGNVFAFALSEFWKRATDPEQRAQLVAEFKELTGPQLVALGAQTARMLPIVQQAEREALGYARKGEPDDATISDAEVDDYVATAERLGAVLEALEEAGYVAPRQLPPPTDP